MRVLIEEHAIKLKVKQLADQISQDFENEELVCLIVLKGAFVFGADLIRELKSTVKVEVAFIDISSYSGTASGSISLDYIPENIEGKNILVIEDIIDTGKSMSALREYIDPEYPQRLKFCTLLDKPSQRLVTFKPDYVGFTIGNEFVVGYGLDHNQKYRELSDIRVLP